MASEHLKEITPEQRADMQEKARISLEIKKEAGKHLKQDFSDEPAWRRMASEVGFRLPATYIKCNDVKYVRRLIKHLGRDVDWYKQCSGYGSLHGFYRDNKDWPMYALCGVILEDHFTEGK